jgi:Ca2+-binding EF-hand superfamily protein
MPISEEDRKRIVEAVGNERTGKINYTEFVMASMDLKQQLSEEVVYNVFAHFDKHSRGYIIA